MVHVRAWQPEGDAQRSKGWEGTGVAYFSAEVPEGNWRVRVHLEGGAEGSEVQFKTETRRWSGPRHTVVPGGAREVELLVNVRTPILPALPTNAPGGTAVQLNAREQGVLHWDNKLTLEINGPRWILSRIVIEPATEIPTVYLAGDSTVTDQPGEPAASWGQILPGLLDTTVAVANHAESGETLKSFFTGHRFDKIFSTLRGGDYLFLQFGHNDAKTQWPQTYAAPDSTYRAYLRAVIAEARLRGATPVLVTSMHRRRFDAEGKIIETHGKYPDAVRAVAKEEGVALIDLHAMSRQLYEAWGPAAAAGAFNDEGKDLTHHNVQGAYALARAVVEGIREAGLPLASAVRPEVGTFTPSAPGPVVAIDWIPGLAVLKERPRGD